MLWGGGYEILFYTDNNAKKWGQSLSIDLKDGLKEFKIKAVSELKKTQFDKIIIASLTGFEAINKQLLELGIEKEKIDFEYAKFSVFSRIHFLENFSVQCQCFNVKGAVAELGVFQGEFAKFINMYFKDKTLYLFDTFEGFSEKDLQKDSEKVRNLGGYLSDTSLELVASKMPYVNKIEFKKGWFPQSAVGLENERFCFVNLDADLYEPIKAGLEWFYPRLVKGGVILVHDYFSLGYVGVKKAVDEFCAKNDLFAYPIGDDISVMVQRLE